MALELMAQLSLLLQCAVCAAALSLKGIHVRMNISKQSVSFQEDASKIYEYLILKIKASKKHNLKYMMNFKKERNFV